jgi:hypothetical protein
MDTIQMHLDIENSLNNTLKQTQQIMKSFNNSLEISAKNMGAIEKQAKSTTISYDDIEESSSGIAKNTGIWSGALSKIRTTLSYVIPSVGAVFSVAAIGESAKAALDFNTQLKNLSFQMGDLGESTETMRKATFGIVRATGIAQENALQMVTTLRSSRIAAEDIRELGTATAQFSEITGASAEASTKLGAELVRTGGLSIESSKDMITQMARVQRQVGMTGSEMEQLGDIIIEDTKWLSQMDKTSGFIEDFNKGTIKLAGAFRQVGIDVSEVGQLMDRMLDPGRIEENALLYAKLGISMQEALSGDLDPAMMTDKLKGLGEELKGMGGPAAAALAQSLGMPLKQLRQMADIDTSNLGETGGDLGQMFKEQESVGESVERTMHRVQGTMTEAFSVMVEKIDAGVTKLKGLPFLKKSFWVGAVAIGVGAFALLFRSLRKKFFALATDFGTAMTEAITMGQEKAAVISQSKQRRTGRREAKAGRIEAGPDFAQMEETANYFDLLADSDLFPAIKGMSRNTADWLRKIAMGSKGVSRLSQITTENNQAIKDRIGLYSQEKVILTENLSRNIENKETVYNDLVERQKQLVALQDSRTISARQMKEQHIISKELDKLDRQRLRLSNRRDGIEERFNKSMERQIKSLQPEALKNMYLEIKGNRETLESQTARNKQRREDLQVQRQALNSQILNTKEAITMAAANGESADEMIKLNNQLKDMENIFEEVNSESTTLEMSIADSTKELNLANKEMEQLLKATGKTSDELESIDVAKREGFLTRMNRAVGSSLNKAASNLKDAFKTARESAAAMGQNIVEKLKPSNWLKSIRARVRGFTDEEGKKTRGIMGKLNSGMGGLGKAMKGLAIPMALMGAAMVLFKPLIEVLKDEMAPIMEILKDVIFDLGSMLAEKVLPSILRIAAKLLPILGTLIDKLLPPVLMVVGKLVEIIGGGLIKIIGKLILGLTQLGIKIGAQFKGERKLREELGSGALLEAFKGTFRGRVSDEYARERLAGMEKDELRDLFSRFRAEQSRLGNVAEGIIDFGETISDVGRTVYETGRGMRGQTTFYDASVRMAGVLEDVADKAERGELLTRPIPGDGSGVDVPAVTTPSGGAQAAQLYAEGGTVRVGSEAEMSVVDTGAQTADNTNRAAEGTEVLVEEQKKQNEKMDNLINTMRDMTTAVGRLVTQMGTR